MNENETLPELSKEQIEKLLAEMPSPEEISRLAEIEERNDLLDRQREADLARRKARRAQRK